MFNDDSAARWFVTGSPKGEGMSAEAAVRILNELLKLDPIATQKIVETRVPCNEGVVNHPTIICAEDGSGVPVVGLIGILNGIVKLEDPEGKVVVTHKENGVLVKFSAMVY
jgi:hypothetical protein